MQFLWKWKIHDLHAYFLDNCYLFINKKYLNKFFVCLHGDKTIIVLFVETPRKCITAKLSIRKPGSSSVLIICDLFNSHALFICKSVVICWLASFENWIKRHINHVISNVVKWFQLTRAHPRQEKLILHIKESTPRTI
jgi:hypothetical protein